MPYHRLALTWPRASRWRPVLGLAYAVLACVVLFVVIAVIAVVVVLTTGTDNISDAPDRIDLYQPVQFTAAMGSIIALALAACFGFKLAGGAPLGLLSSVGGGLRWTWLGRCLVGAGVVILAQVLVGVGVDRLFPTDPPSTGASEPAGDWLLLVLILLLVPLQSAAEEYLFRGVLMQTIGAWLRHPAWAIVLPVPLFVVGHSYDLPGQVSVATFALVSGWLVWRTGGLEAAIALHVANNVIVCAMGWAGWYDLNASQTDWTGTLLSTLGALGYALWVSSVPATTGGMPSQA